MIEESIGSGRRVAEIHPGWCVFFFRVTGKVRLTKHEVYAVECDSLQQARYWARQWCHKIKLP